MKSNKSPISGVSLKLYHQVHKSILSGAPRAGDRLHAAGLRDDDRCDTDNKRHDIAHLWWHCSKHQDTRSVYTKAIQECHDKLVKQIGSFASIKVQETINLTCFQHCGICPEQNEIIEARKNATPTTSTFTLRSTSRRSLKTPNLGSGSNGMSPLAMSLFTPMARW